MTDPIDPKPATVPASATAAKPAKPVKTPLDPRSRNAMRLGILLSVLGGAALLFSLFAWYGGSARDSLRYAVNGWLPGVKTTASGVEYKELTPGKGPHPTDADVALIKYNGQLLDGSTFDASEQPVPMPIKGTVPGFSEALKLMSKGSKFRVWIPAKLGYGAEEKKDPTGKVAIPANSTLVFDIELIDFLPQSVIDQYRQQMMSSMGGAGGMPGGAPGGDGAPGAGAPPGGDPTGAAPTAPAPAPSPKGK